MSDNDTLEAFGTPCVRTDFVEVEVEGERLVLDSAAGALHHLDSIASAIWPFLDGSVTASELAGDLAAAFDVSQEAVCAQLLELLRALDAKGLLVDSKSLAPTENRGRTALGYLTDPPSP